jgi:hypothetical protein
MPAASEKQKSLQGDSYSTQQSTARSSALELCRRLYAPKIIAGFDGVIL